MKLNLGCGELRHEGREWLNIDLRAGVADIVCDVTHLPFDDEDADEAVALDLLEHFPASRTHEVLAEWHRVLRPGGTLTVKVPNMQWLCRALVSYDSVGKHDSVVAIINNIMGGHRWGPGGAWDTHHHNFTPVLLARTLDECGFEVRSNDREPNMKVVAVRR